MSEFTEGQIVYDERGATRYYVAPHGDRHLVRGAWTDEYTGDPYPSDAIIEIGQVFAKPPVEHYATEIQAALGELDALARRADEIRAESMNAERTLKAAKKAHPGDNILDLLTGKVTHVVRTSYYYDVVNLSEVDVKSHSVTLSLDKRSRPTIKAWLRKTGEYDNDYPILLATSEAEAVEKLKAYIAKELANSSSHNYAGIVFAADEWGVPVPPQIREKVNAERLKRARDQLKSATRQRDKAATEIEEATALICELDRRGATELQEAQQ